MSAPRPAPAPVATGSEVWTSLPWSGRGRTRRPAVGGSRFPSCPVRVLIEQRMLQSDVSLPELAATVGIPLRTLHRVLHAQVLGWMVADRCAVALGYHPCQLWPNWFPDQTAADTDDIDVVDEVRIAG